jgi:hypothetical protein
LRTDRRAGAEGLAGFGLVLPGLLRILPWLTPVAAAGLVVLMLGAIVFHVRRREYPNIGLNAVLGVLAAIVAWGSVRPVSLLAPATPQSPRRFSIWAPGNSIRITLRWSSLPNILG